MDTPIQPTFATTASIPASNIDSSPKLRKPALTAEQRKERQREYCRRWYAKLPQRDKDERCDHLTELRRKKRHAKRHVSTGPAPELAAPEIPLHTLLLQNIVTRDGRLFLKSDPATPICKVVRHRKTMRGVFTFTAYGKTHSILRCDAVYLLHTGKQLFVHPLAHLDGNPLNDTFENLIQVIADPYDPATHPFPGVTRTPEGLWKATFLQSDIPFGHEHPFELHEHAVDAAIAVARDHLSRGHTSLYSTSPELRPILNAIL